MDGLWIANNSHLRNNEAIQGMINLFLSCQRCSQLTQNPKQLKCSHTICVKCASRYRTRSIHGEFWTLECATCRAVNAWRDEAGELSGLSNNMLMQQISAQIKPQIDIPKEARVKKEKFESSPVDNTTMGERFHSDIVTAVKEKIEVQEAMLFAKKKIEKHQHQTRYVKNYGRRIDKTKNAMIQLISQATELLVANVMEEKAKLLHRLEEMFQEEMHPVFIARENMNKKSVRLEILTRICDIATQMTQHGTAAIDLALFKGIVRKNIEEINKLTLPSDIRRKYRSNVSLTFDCGKFGALVGDFVSLSWKRMEASIEECGNTIFNDQYDISMDEQPIYDLPPEFENVAQQRNEEIKVSDEIVYDEISVEYNNSDPQCVERSMSSPPKAPKNNHLQDYTIAHMALELAERVKEFEDQKAGSILDKGGEFEYDNSDSFSSEADNANGISLLCPDPTGPSSRKLDIIRQEAGLESGLDTINRFLTIRHSHHSKKDTDSGISNQAGNEFTIKSSTKQVRLALGVRNLLFKSNFYRPKAPVSTHLILSIGRLRKAGLKKPFSHPPEIFADKLGKIWINDSANYLVHAYEGSNAKLILSFKTILKGIRMKARSITTVEDGSQIATSCERYVIVWDCSGKFLRRYGPRSDVRKFGGVAVDQTGKLIMADVGNAQIVFEDKHTIIGNICSQKTGRPIWPGRIAINTEEQIITADYNEHCIKMFTTSGELIKKFGGFGTEKGRMRYPSGVAVDTQNRIYVADECNNRITVYSADGSVCCGDVLTRGDGIKFPHSVALLPNGNIVVSDESKFVRVFKGLNI